MTQSVLDPPTPLIISEDGLLSKTADASPSELSSNNSSESRHFKNLNQVQVQRFIRMIVVALNSPARRIWVSLYSSLSEPESKFDITSDCESFESLNSISLQVLLVIKKMTKF